MELLVEFIFEKSEEMPNDFYVNIMDLIKKSYHDSNKISEIYKYLEQFGSKIKTDLLNQIKERLPLQNEIVVVIQENTFTPYQYFVMFYAKAISFFIFIFIFFILIYKNEFKI